MDERYLVKIKEGWPKWLVVLATVLNFIGIIIFLAVLFGIREIVLANPIIEGRIYNYVGLVGYASALGILTLVAGSSIILLLNPWINFKKLMEGDGLSKLSGAIIFSFTLLALAIIVLAAN
jgi:hypothetical protein